MPEWLVGRLSDRFSLVILQKLKHVASVIAELFLVHLGLTFV